MIRIAVPFRQPLHLCDILADSLMPFGHVYTDRSASDGDFPSDNDAPSFFIHRLACSEQPDARFALLAAVDLPSGVRTLSPAYHTKLVLSSGSNRLRRALVGSPCASVFCGTSAADTITLSSNCDNRLWLSVQRSISTLDGDVIDPCELVVHTRADMHAAMVTAAVMLMCGCPMRNGGYWVGEG